MTYRVFRTQCQAAWCALFLAASASGADLALTHATIYPAPDVPPLTDAAIVLHNGKIATLGRKIKIPRRAHVIDCRGLTVTAGFWNSHVHLLTPSILHADRLSAADLAAQLRDMFMRWGFTTVFDITSVLDNTNLIRRRVETGEVSGPRIFTTGDPFYPRAGTPVYIKDFLESNHLPSVEVANAEEAVARLRRQLRAGADGVKIFAGAILPNRVLPMPLEIAKALVAEAHRAGKPVFAHPSNLQGIEIALQSGSDILAHTVAMSGPWSPPFTDRLRTANVALIPTLTLFHVEMTKDNSSPQDTEFVLNRVINQLAAYSKAGGEILFGTDIGYIDQYDTTEEFALMTQAGLTFEQQLASLTTSPARRFGQQSHSGRLAKGYDADLTVFEGTSFSKVRYTIRKGARIF
jgi:imidazolonepropionase-like amidohydrolase